MKIDKRVAQMLAYIASRYGQHTADAVLENERTFADWEALLIEAIEDDGMDAAAEAAVARYERDAALAAAEKAAAERQSLRDAVEDALMNLGFCLTGASERSEALYFDHPEWDALRVRVAEHEPIYEESAACWQIAIRDLYPSAHVVVDCAPHEVREVITQWFETQYLAHATVLKE